MQLRHEAGIGDVHLAFNAGGREVPKAIMALRPVAIMPEDRAKLGYAERTANASIWA